MPEAETIHFPLQHGRRGIELALRSSWRATWKYLSVTLILQPVSSRQSNLQFHCTEAWWANPHRYNNSNRLGAVGFHLSLHPQLHALCLRLLEDFYKVISLTFIHQHTNNRQFAIFALMDKMSLHSVRCAVYLVFAGAVEVELQKFIPLVSNCCVTTIFTVNLDGMAIIDDFQRSSIVVDIYTLQLCLVSEGNTDRGLAFSSFAFGILRFYITPVFRSIFTFITPVDWMTFFSGFFWAAMTAQR